MEQQGCSATNPFEHATALVLHVLTEHAQLWPEMDTQRAQVQDASINHMGEGEPWLLLAMFGHTSITLYC